MSLESHINSPALLAIVPDHLGVRDMAYAPTFADTIDSNLIGSAIYSVGIYFNLYVLVPNLLMKRKRAVYIASVIPLILIIAVATAWVFALYFRDIHLGTSQFFGSAQGVANTGGDFLVVYGLATCLYFINEWYIKERRIRELESSNLKSELSLLKRQIHPHFLFNALNSVHVLIGKDPEKARLTLERFSDLLSHQIYEVNKEKVSLAEEIQNLDNYLQIQKLRHEDHVKIDWQVSGELKGKKISPMLFLNFVENAFKHGQANGEKRMRVSIHVIVTHHMLVFIAINSIKNANGHSERPGVGIANARRRLELLYPGRHQLEISSTDQSFEVKLTIELDED